MRVRPPRSLALAVVVAFLLVAPLVGPALASAQPNVACGVCGEKFERSAEEAGVTITVTHSTADVRVHANGTATWVVKNRLTGESAERLRNASVGVRAVTRAAFASSPSGPVRELNDLDARLVDDTVVVAFSDEAPVTHSFGTTLVEYFDTDGSDAWYQVNADRLSVVGPERTRVTNEPAHASVEGRNVTWYSDSGDRYGGPDLVYGEGRIVYTPTDAANPDLRTTATLWGDTLPIYLDNVRSYVVPTTIVFGGLVALGLGLVRETDRDRAGRLGKGLFAVGLAVVLGGLALTLLPRSVDLGGTPIAGAALVACLGWVAASRPERYRGARSAAAVGLVVLTVVLLAVAPVLGVLGWLGGDSLWVALAKLGTLLLPLALAPAAGVLASRSRVRAFAFGWALVAGAAALAGVTFVPTHFRPFGLIIVVMLLWAVVGAVVVTPLAALGAGLARD